MNDERSSSSTSDRAGASTTDEPVILKHDGKPAYVVLPYHFWRDLVDQAEDAEAVRAYDRAKAHPDQETVPIGVADALLGGQNPMRVWREHRGLTQAELAEAAGVRHAYIAQLESGRRRGSTAVLARVARTRAVEIDDLI